MIVSQCDFDLVSFPVESNHAAASTKTTKTTDPPFSTTSTFMPTSTPSGRKIH